MQLEIRKRKKNFLCYVNLFFFTSYTVPYKILEAKTKRKKKKSTFLLLLLFKPLAVKCENVPLFSFKQLELGKEGKKRKNKRAYY